MNNVSHKHRKYHQDAAMAGVPIGHAGKARSPFPISSHNPGGIGMPCHRKAGDDSRAVSGRGCPPSLLFQEVNGGGRKKRRVVGYTVYQSSPPLCCSTLPLPPRSPLLFLIYRAEVSGVGTRLARRSCFMSRTSPTASALWG